MSPSSPPSASTDAYGNELMLALARRLVPGRQDSVESVFAQAQQVDARATQLQVDGDYCSGANLRRSSQRRRQRILLVFNLASALVDVWLNRRVPEAVVAEFIGLSEHWV